MTIIPFRLRQCSGSGSAQNTDPMPVNSCTTFNSEKVINFNQFAFNDKKLRELGMKIGQNKELAVLLLTSVTVRKKLR